MKVKLLKKIRKRFDVFYDRQRSSYYIIAYDKKEEEFLLNNKYGMTFDAFSKKCLETIFIYQNTIDKINQDHDTNYKKRKNNSRLKQLRNKL